MSIHYFTLYMKCAIKYFILIPNPGTVDSWTANPRAAELQLGIAMANPGAAKLQLGILNPGRPSRPAGTTPK
jgi:hypothetical protein